MSKLGLHLFLLLDSAPLILLLHKQSRQPTTHNSLTKRFQALPGSGLANEHFLNHKPIGRVC